MRYSEGPRASTAHMILPNGYPEALYVWGSTISASREGQDYGKLKGGIVYGQLLHTQRIAFSASSTIYGIVFTPLGFRRLVADDSMGVCDCITSLEEVGREAWGPFAWMSSLDHAPDLSAFALRADSYLSTLLSDGREGEPRWLRPVVQQMLASGGRMPVSHFYELTSVSQRQFEGKFIDYLGCRPKQFLRTLRFANFFSRSDEMDVDIISLANECGFYDQAHLCHEVKRITGLTPQQYMKAGAQLFGK